MTEIPATAAPLAEVSKKRRFARLIGSMEHISLVVGSMLCFLPIPGLPPPRLEGFMAYTAFMTVWLLLDVRAAVRAKSGTSDP